MAALAWSRNQPDRDPQTLAAARSAPAPDRKRPVGVAFFRKTRHALSRQDSLSAEYSSSLTQAHRFLTTNVERNGRSTQDSVSRFL